MPQLRAAQAGLGRPGAGGDGGWWQRAAWATETGARLGREAAWGAPRPRPLSRAGCPSHTPPAPVENTRSCVSCPRPGRARAAGEEVVGERNRTQLEPGRRQRPTINSALVLGDPQAGPPVRPRAGHWGLGASCVQRQLAGHGGGGGGRLSRGRAGPGEGGQCGARETALPFWMTAQRSPNFFSQPLAPGPVGSVLEKA